MRREAYFTPENITSKASEMLQALAEIHPHRPHFVPRRAALLALDLQGYFLQESSHAFIPSAPAILPGINQLMRAFAQHRLPIILSRHLNTPQDAGLMASWWRHLLTEDNPLSQLDARLESVPAIQIRKTRYDAFLGGTPPLEALLREYGVEQVVIGGVMTHLCCETTARSAFMRGFQVFFLVDGTATYTEAFHRASLLNLTHGFAVPVLVQDILETLENA